MQTYVKVLTNNIIIDRPWLAIEGPFHGAAACQSRFTFSTDASVMARLHPCRPLRPPFHSLAGQTIELMSFGTGSSAIAITEVRAQESGAASHRDDFVGHALAAIRLVDIKEDRPWIGAIDDRVGAAVVWRRAAHCIRHGIVHKILLRLADARLYDPRETRYNVVDWIEHAGRSARIGIVWVRRETANLWTERAGEMIP